MFGPHERAVSDAFRSIFVDLAALTREIGARAPSPGKVLEIGCGDGIMTEHLATLYPQARITGIDICPEPGRLFRGDAARVRFLRASAPELSAAERHSYELVVIADVIHHVPRDERIPLLNSAVDLVIPGGTVIFKEWLREPTAICLTNFLFERIITGDRVSYLREHEFRTLTTGVFGRGSIRGEFRIGPWSSNMALIVVPRRQADI
jgi:2-polyprenyl-6-hydroxyphenyl methylase/3-demethylubiquinone-9 3-methyltransferase